MTLTAATLTASVVIPSYNHAAFIAQAVGSALAWRDPGLEVVVVDDGSTDDSVAILEDLARQDPRLRLFRQENRGAHAALNRGVELARGEVVFILNSDDVFHPERLPRALERFAARSELVMLGSFIEIIDGEGKPLGVKEAWRNMPPWPRRRRGPALSDLGDPALALLEANYLATTSNVAFRRRLFEDEGRFVPRFLPLRYTHDWDFFLGALEAGAFEILEKPLVQYRVHANNTIREERDEALARGRMRFEILWVVARHAERLLMPPAPGDTTARQDVTRQDLAERLWSSLPDFTPEALFAQLLALRGRESAAPPAYDRLLEEGHPFRAAAVEVLANDVLASTGEAGS